MLSSCMGIFSLNFSLQLVKFKDEKEVADENTDWVHPVNRIPRCYSNVFLRLNLKYMYFIDTALTCNLVPGNQWGANLDLSAGYGTGK